MQELIFVLPTENNRKDVLDFYREFEMGGGRCIGYDGYQDFDAWLDGMQNRYTGKNLPKGYVRENFYLCYHERELIGVFSLKFTLTEYLLNYGGHVGYAVRPSERGKGWATCILCQGLEIAKIFGFDRLLCVCDEDNYASEKVLLKNGGVLENKLLEEGEEIPVKRFWIEV